MVSVTDVEERMHSASWMILWCGYLFATIACGIQAWRDHRRYDPSSDLDVEQGVPNNREGNETSSGDSTRSSVSVLGFLNCSLDYRKYQSSSFRCIPLQVFSVPVLCTIHANRSHSCGSLCKLKLCATDCRDASRNDICIGLDAFGVIFCSFGWSCLRRGNVRATWKHYTGDSLWHLLDFDSYGLVERSRFSVAVCCAMLHLCGFARDAVVFWPTISHDFAAEPVAQIWPRNSTDWMHAYLHDNIRGSVCKPCTTGGRSTAGKEVVVDLRVC